MKPSSASACVGRDRAEGLGDERALRAGVDVLDHRILLGGIEIHGPDDGAPDVGLAVAALGDEDFGKLEAGGEQGGGVALVEIHHHLLVVRAAKLRDRRQIDARPGVDVVLVVGREGHGVIAVGVGEFREAGAVEIDAVILREVRVLAGNHAAGLEPDLALRVVDALDVADQPVALRDLILHLAGDAVVEIEMLPAIALGGPDDLLAVVDVVAVAAARGEPGAELVVVEERLALLVDQGARLAGLARPPRSRDRPGGRAGCTRR